MIKVTVGEQKTQEAKPFPKLMKSKTGRIVFMLSDSTGFQLNKSSNDDPHFSRSWNIGDFTDYNEPITLQNA